MEKRIFYEMAKFIEIPVVITLLFSVLSRRNHYVRPRPQRFFDDPATVIARSRAVMWVLDLLTDTIVIALLPSLVILLGMTAVLAWHWPAMGLVVAVGAVAYIGLTLALSLRLPRRRQGWAMPGIRVSAVRWPMPSPATRW